MKLLPSARYRRFLAYAFGLLGLLLVAHWTTVLLVEPGSAQANTLVGSLFDLDREYNAPTATNSFLLISSGIFSMIAAASAKRRLHRTGWSLFALLFVYLGLDELLIIHEQAAEPLRKLLNISGSNPLYHAWVIPALAVIALLLLTIMYIKKHAQELKVFYDVLLLVTLLGIGVVTFEILGTYVYGNIQLYRWVMVPVEEVFELSMAVLIYFRTLETAQEGLRGGKKKAAI